MVLQSGDHRNEELHVLPRIFTQAKLGDGNSCPDTLSTSNASQTAMQAQGYIGKIDIRKSA